MIETVGTVGTGYRKFSARMGTVVLLAMLAGAAFVPPQASATEIWNGPKITFRKDSYTDWTLPENQDQITTNVSLTRANNQGLFNIINESSYGGGDPTDTEWAYGTTANRSVLAFDNWRDWARQNGDRTPDIVGRDAVVHLISDDIYIDIKFTSWVSGSSGGGFSYERSAAVNITLNGPRLMFVLTNSVFTDPGVTAEDLTGNPLAVTTNGTVDTSILGTYDLTYEATNADGLGGYVSRTVEVMERLPEIWSGADFAFAKTNYANWGAAANQDRITTNVWLTRANQEGLFNYVTESEYGSGPDDTEWAYGTTADLGASDFMSWYDWARSLGDTPSILGRDAVLHLLSEDIYIDIKFTSWTIGGMGGGFSYLRAAPVRMTMNGSPSMTVTQGGVFADPGATAVDSVGTALAVTTNSTVDVNTPGVYEVTYRAVDSQGRQGSAKRFVGVIPPTTQIWNHQGVRFHKLNYADCTQPESQDQITPNVWLTRDDNEGLFNSVNESSYSGSTPSDTEWATGTTADLWSLHFMSWYDWAQSIDNPPATVGRSAVLHLISDDIYIDIKFTSWTQNDNGGGFSYERAGVVFVTLNGDRVIYALTNSVFTDPGATAVDLAGNPLAVTTNGTVDTSIEDTYPLLYEATNATGQAGYAARFVRVVDRLPQIWNGNRITFTKLDGVDWRRQENQDRITTNVWITRQTSHGLFNMATEPEYDSSTPSDTEWSYGTTANLWDLTFTSWYDWADADNGPPDTVGRDAVLHLISDDIYIDIKVTHWSQAGTGGGFSYERATAVRLALRGTASMGVLLGGTFSDPGATAVDMNGNPLAVTTNGTVNANVAGLYTLTYRATDALGNTASAIRRVRVLNQLPQIWNGRRMTFTKTSYTDWTLPANQDRITDNVWLTRQNQEGLFNMARENQYYSDGAPSDTEWAFGTTDDLWALNFMSWYDWVQYLPGYEIQGPPLTVGRNAVVHLITDDIYIDIKFTFWAMNSSGGGFSYERATSSPWIGAVDINGTWKWLNWYGYFSDVGEGWIYHAEHGWLFCDGTSTASMWFWSPRTGWLWSSQSVYPFLWDWNDSAGTWLWYYRGTGNGAGGWYYNYARGRAEWH